MSRVVSAALALALGVLVYLCWRTGLQVHRVPFAAELAMFGAAYPVPPWVKGSLPDALWQYAYTAIVAELWRDEPWRGRKLVFVGAPALAGVVIEMLQRVHVFPGTFDWMDVVLSLGASALAIVLVRPRVRSEPACSAMSLAR